MNRPIRPIFLIGERVQLIDHQGIPLATRRIARIEYDAEGRLWAGFHRKDGKFGNKWFYVSEDKMVHQDRETGYE